MSDAVNSPSHYVQASVTIEPIDVLRYAPFDLGNAMKYFIRAGHKDNKKQDLEKAQKYINWALENYNCEYKPYDEYFRRYELFIGKFKVFQDLIESEHFAQPFMRRLSKRIDDELEECK